MNNPLFSIVIPTYNRAELLKRCLDSVVAQTYEKWEAIIVDNYSEDNTEEVVKSYNDSRIRYIKNHNYGIISVSRNKALDMSEGEWICFLDSDDYWFPEKLNIIRNYTDTFELIYHEYYTNRKKVRPFQSNSSKFYTIKECSIPYVLMRGDPINPSCTAVAKSAIGNVRFPEDNNLNAIEDYDFFIQLIDKKIKIKHLNKILTFYDANTGCSHGRKEIDRLRQLFIKYKHMLTKNELREAIKYYYLKKADYFCYPGGYKKAFSYYRIGASSKASVIRIKGVKRAIKALILYLIKIKKV